MRSRRRAARASPERIAGEVQGRIADLGPGGLLLAPAYDIDFTPRENLAAFVHGIKASAQPFPATGHSTH